MSLMLVGCASLDDRVFTLGLDAGGDNRRLFWPAPATREVPRYVYVGALIGEGNFVRSNQDQDGVLRTLGRLLEFIQGEASPKRLDRPQSGMIDADGRILVTDLGRGAVFVFDEKRARFETWDLADGLRGFVAPVGIAPGPEGQVFVADADLALVARLDSQGNPLPAIGKGQLQRPNGVAFDPTGQRLFVADTQAHQIKTFDLEGNLLATWGSRGDQPGQFSYPTHIAIRDGKLYVSDTLNARVQILSATTGEPEGTVGHRGLFVGNLVRPKGVAVDSEHNVYVIESYFDHLLVYNRRGEFLMPIGGVGNAPGRFHLPSGVWLDSRNRLFIADTLNSRISVFQFLGGGSENE
jgi:sugar lactone lactonase YvrE